MEEWNGTMEHVLGFTYFTYTYRKNMKKAPIIFQILNLDVFSLVVVP